MKSTLAFPTGAALALVVAATASLAPVRAEAASPASGAPAVSCDQLAKTAFPDAKITLAEQRPAGVFSIPGPPSPFGPSSVSLPAFCRIAATLTPSADSDIRMELWLPANWNGKFMMVGNGGWSGSISYSAMAEPLGRGYAVASTDTGHEGGRGTFAFGHPEKLVDFAWRAVHETTVKSKALTAAYYGGRPRLSYWNGCSSGGKQGLKEVQDFPADYDGVIAGAPANNWMGLQVQSLAANLANTPKGGKPILGPPQIALIHTAVLKACDGLDGVGDSQVADPRACAFKASSIVCKPGQDASTCLTPEQAAVADRIYEPVRDPGTSALVFPGLSPGSEEQWPIVILAPWSIGIDTFGLAHADPNWDPYTFDPAKDLALAEKAEADLPAIKTDLSAFKARGGKLIQYHGWADALIAPENSMNYYESVIARQGGLDQAAGFYRLFMVPGMGHCGGAYGVDWITALEQWVEAGKAPDAIPGKRLPPVRFGLPPAASAGPPPDLGSRPICAYPDVATFKGSRSDKDPVSFECRAGERGARPADRP
jgi:feruloyl esterase